MHVRYGIDTVKHLWKFTMLDFKTRKNEDLVFLKICCREGLKPKLLDFKLENSNLRYSITNKQCQNLLFNQKIKRKISIIPVQIT